MKNKPHSFHKLQVKKWSCKRPQTFYPNTLAKFAFAKQIFKSKTKQN